MKSRTGLEQFKRNCMVLEYEEQKKVRMPGPTKPKIVLDSGVLEMLNELLASTSQFPFHDSLEDLYPFDKESD